MPDLSLIALCRYAGAMAYGGVCAASIAGHPGACGGPIGGSLRGPQQGQLHRLDGSHLQPRLFAPSSVLQFPRHLHGNRRCGGRGGMSPISMRWPRRPGRGTLPLPKCHLTGRARPDFIAQARQTRDQSVLAPGPAASPPAARLAPRAARRVPAPGRRGIRAPAGPPAPAPLDAAPEGVDASLLVRALPAVQRVPANAEQPRNAVRPQPPALGQPHVQLGKPDRPNYGRKRLAVRAFQGGPNIGAQLNPPVPVKGLGPRCQRRGPQGGPYYLRGRRRPAARATCRAGRGCSRRPC